ncbi:endonuclease-reverse transcriptase, partial [Paramuricea clavata]
MNVAMTWAREGKRKRGRPKTTWRRTVEKERVEAGLRSWDEARGAKETGNRKSIVQHVVISRS